MVFVSVWLTSHSMIISRSVKMKVKLFSCMRLLETPRTVTHQAPLSMEFSRQEHWSGLPFPSPGDFPDPGIEPWSPALQADSLPFETPGKSRSIIALNRIWFIKVEVKVKLFIMSDSLQPYGLYPTRLLRPWDFPGKSIGVDCLFLLQGIFPTQGLNPGLLHCWQMLYPLSHQGSPGP